MEGVLITGDGISYGHSYFRRSSEAYGKVGNLLCEKRILRSSPHITLSISNNKLICSANIAEYSFKNPCPVSGYICKCAVLILLYNTILFAVGTNKSLSPAATNTGISKSPNRSYDPPGFPGVIHAITAFVCLAVPSGPT